VDRPHPLAFLLRWWLVLREWLASLQATQPLLYWVVFWLLLAVLAGIFAHALWIMGRTLRAAGSPREARAEGDRLVVRDAAWYRRDALRLARAGHYPEAMQADFLGLVLELDQRRVLRYHPSKTPNEYTNEAQLGEPARGMFHELVRLLYGYAFARQPCGAGDFQAWRERTVTERYAAPH
jgi:hypothetical protein